MLPARLLPCATVLGADDRGGRDGAKSSLEMNLQCYRELSNVVIDYNAVDAYIRPYEA